jgi:hypothetical protein
MNIEQAVIDNLRLLPTDRQRDVLVFIHSLLPLDTEAQIRAEILEQVIPPLQQIQNFYDGLPSAVYASKLLRATQALADQFSDSALSQVLQAVDQSLSPDQRWGSYTVEYYQTVTQLLSELTARSTLTSGDIEFAIHKIGQISETMTQPGITMGQELEDYVEA